MQCHGAKAFLHQVIGQPITFNLGAGEDDRLVHGRVTQRMVEQLALVRHVVGPQQRLRDRSMLFMRRINLHTLRLAHHTRSKLHDARCKGGAEHHGLLALNGQLVDFGQVIGKAQVQHTVGLVHHQELHLIELDLHAALQVQQASGRRHHQIGVLQLGNLQLVRNTTDNVGNTQTATMPYQINRVGADLLRQLTGRAQNQGARRCGLEVSSIGRIFALRFFQRRFTAGDGLCTKAFKLSTLVTLGLFLLHQQGVKHRQ